MINTKKIVCIFAVLLTVNISFAVNKIKSGNRINIPQIGLSLKLFKKMESRPATLPNTYKTKITRKNVFKTDEIWRYKQFVGKWANINSDITVAQIGLSADMINPEFVMEEDAKSKFDIDSLSVDWTNEKINKWINSYFKLSFTEKLNSIALSKNCTVDRYFRDEQDYRYYLCIISAKSKIKQRIAILYKIDNSISKKDAEKAVINSIRSLKYIKIEEKNKVKYLNKAAYDTGKDNNSFSKELLLNNVKNYKDWNIIEASDYFIATNCNIKGKSDSFIKLVVNTLKNEELVYQVFNKRKNKTNNKFIVRVFKDRDDYTAYVGKNFEWTGGIWMSSKKELVLTKANYTSSERDRFVRILKHEAFHQYIHYAIGEILTGAWFNEGYAVFFENVNLVGKRIYIKLDKTKLKYIKKCIDDPNLAADIESLFEMSYKEFYGRDKSTYNYNLAWAIIYYLNTGIKSTWKKYKRNYSKILPNYYSELYKTKDNSQATKAAWENVDLKLFAKDFSWFYRTQVSSGKTVSKNL